MHKRICGCNPISGDTAWVGHTGVMTGAITQVQATPFRSNQPAWFDIPSANALPGIAVHPFSRGGHASIDVCPGQRVLSGFKVRDAQ